MMRRDFITLLGGAAVAWPLAAHGQQGGRVRRIGVLLAFAESDPDSKAWLTALEEGLQKLGWSPGRNVRIDYRWGGGGEQRLQSYAAELVGGSPDVLFCAGTQYYRTKACELRESAAQSAEGDELLRIAQDYDRLADKAEKRARRPRG